MIAFLVLVIAQVAADNPALYAYGPMGVMLGWFMLRGEKLAAHIVRELVEMKETNLLDIVSRPSATPTVRRMAQNKLDEIEVRRKGK